MPARSGPPGDLLRGKSWNWSEGKGGGAQRADQKVRPAEGWQPWRGKAAMTTGAMNGGHTLTTANYWQPLQQSKTPAVRPRGLRLWGADEEPSVPIRNGLNASI